MTDNVKPRIKSTQGFAQIKGELVKSKLESRRSRTCDGIPVSYSSIKDDNTTVKPEATGALKRESRSFSDPDISGSLAIFSEANGLFSKANQASLFKRNSAESLRPTMAAEERPSFISPIGAKQQVKDLKSAFEHCSIALDGSQNQQHMAEYSNPLHKGNQHRFRKGEGVISPIKPAISPKPIIAPKPKLIRKPNKELLQQSNKIIPKEDISNSSSKICSDDEGGGLYAKVSHEKPSIPPYPPPRKLPRNTNEDKVQSTDKNGDSDKQAEEGLSSKEENDTETKKEMSEPPLYAQIPSTDKNGDSDKQAEEGLSSKEKNDTETKNEMSEPPLYAEIPSTGKNAGGSEKQAEEGLSSKEENDTETKNEMSEPPLYAEIPSTGKIAGDSDKQAEEGLSSKEENDTKTKKEMSEPPLYAQVDRSKKTDKLLINHRSRSESDPSPMNIDIASSIKYEVLAQDPEVKQSDATINEEVESDDDSEGWDPDEFDDDDDDSSDFEARSDTSSLSNSQDVKETMNFPDERSKKLYNIAHEILTTERAYVRRLHLLDQVFYFRLQNECLSHGHITVDVLHDVFSNISAIHSLHKDFLLPKLEERMSQWSTDNRIGDILKTLAPFLKLYVAYIANFDKSSETLSTWTKKSPVFASIIEDIQKSKDCENLILGHHMLEPIQRIPRYKLLLKDYLGKLPEDSPDYKDTQDAVEIISEAAAHANESMKKTESFKKLLDIQERIIEDYDVITAGRQFIKEGDLAKVAARHVAHQERTLLLFNDVLLCCAKIPGTNKLKVKVEMDLYGMELGEADEEVELLHTFRVTSKQKVIDFSASSQEERETWVKEINDAVQEFSRKRETYKRGPQPNAISNSELGKKAPVWVRDEVVTMCMSCDSLFTLTRRRHHCRACGGIYCNSCCHHKAPLEYSGKQERICQTCHKVLVRGAKASTIRKNVEAKHHQDVRKMSRDSNVILSGYLKYKGGKASDKSWAKRWCVLSNTFEFYCYKAKKDTKADFSLPLPGYVVDKPNLADNLDKKIAFKLHHKNVVVHYFATDSQEVLQRWMHNLSYAVQAERIPEEESNESNVSQQANTI